MYTHYVPDTCELPLSNLHNNPGRKIVFWKLKRVSTSLISLLLAKACKFLVNYFPGKERGGKSRDRLHSINKLAYS